MPRMMKVPQPPTFTKCPSMKPNTDANVNLFERARQVIPGGVNSPVRAFRAVGGTPRFVKRAQGPYFWDANDQRYIDYIGSWGPMILGHGHPAVLEAVQKAALDGFSFGAPTEREIELAEEIIRRVPSLEMVRLVSSGTEAAMSAIRLARGATGRSKFIKFEGCYHGHADALLVKAGSGLATFGNPTSAGVPPEVVQHTLVLEYNNLAQLEEAFALHGPELACVMIEPIAGNMNFVRTSVPFMRRCRELCTEHGALLVFDEVMTGFRVALGGAQIESEDLQPIRPLRKIRLLRIAHRRVAGEARGDDQLRAGPQQLDARLIADLHASAREQRHAPAQIRRFAALPEIQLRAIRAELVIEMMDRRIVLLADVAVLRLDDVAKPQI